MAEDSKPIVAYLGPEGSYTHQVRRPTYYPILS
jgi:prephenate dehydratase